MIDWEKSRQEWDARTKMFGTRAVFNICHKSAEELTEITKVQTDTIFPIFKKAISARPMAKTLDFGCGYGRWTHPLCAATGGLVLGVDPTPFLLEQAEAARTSAKVFYRLYSEGRIPAEDAEFDIVWACLVLSTVLNDEMLKVTIQELGRVLKKGGLMFLIDNTAGPSHRPVVRSRWSMSRTVDEYRKAFSGWVDLQKAGAYFDLGEENSILFGRKR